MCHLMEAITSKIVSLSKDAVEVDCPNARNEVFQQIRLLSGIIGEGAARATQELKQGWAFPRSPETESEHAAARKMLEESRARIENERAKYAASCVDREFLKSNTSICR